MKLGGKDARRYFAAPDPDAAGALIHGGDAMRVSLRRRELVSALVGPEGEAEMRLTRIAAADLRREPALLFDAMRAQGFFPGPRVALVEDATDTVAATLAAALADWAPGDAQIVVTAGALTPRSTLRKAFESHRSAFAIGVYADAPDRSEVEATLSAAGLATPEPAAFDALLALARDLDPGDFAQTVEKLALYKLDDPEPAAVADLAAIAPATIDTALDTVLDAVAAGRHAELGAMLQRLAGQGVAAVTLLIGATRHFRQLLAAAADPRGAESALDRMRPRVFGPRRDTMARDARRWGATRLEQALHQLVETDLAIRSPNQRAPQMAMVERTLIRLAMLGAR